MKKIVFVGLFLSVYTLCFAQKREFNTPYQKQFLMELMGGANFDMIHSSADPASLLMTTRPTTCPMIGVKVAHLFSKRIGWYANIHFNFYREKESDQLKQSTMEEFVQEFFYYIFGPIARIRPSLDAGLTYRFEKNRWALYPRLGIGYMYYMGNRDRIKEKNEKTMTYQQKAHPLFLNTGFSVNYSFAKRGYLVFNADFRQPLQKSYAELTYKTDETEIEKIYYQTRTAGRGLTCGLGIGLKL